MENVLLLIHDDPGQEARLQAALDLVRALNGHLICLQVNVPPDVLPEVYMAVGPDSLVAEAKARESANRARIEPRLSREGVTWDWREVTGEFATAIEDAARLADLVIVNPRIEDLVSPDMARAVRELIAELGKPILVVPEAARGLAVAGPALVAWDGSPQASAALAAAVPLLRIAQSATLLEVGEHRRGTAIEEAAAYLSRHGVHAVVQREAGSGDTPGDILDAAERIDAAYLVMGGFGRGRLFESLFGGVTRTLLRDSGIPMLIMHGAG